MNDHLQEESIDLKKLIFRYLPYWYVFALSVILALAVAYVFNRLAEPVYSVQSTVLISDKSKGGMGMGQFMGELDMFGSRSNLADQLVILTSYSVVDSTIRRMDLDVSYYETSRFMGFSRRREVYNDAPFRVDWNKEGTRSTEEPFNIKIIDDHSFQLETPEKRNTSRFGELINGYDYKFTVHRNHNFDPEKHIDQNYQFILRDHSKLLNEYVAGTRAEPLNRDAWIIQISFESTHLQRSIAFVNTLTDNFIQKGLSEKNIAARNTLNFIDEQISITTDSLFLAESNLQEFRQDRQLMDVSFLATQLLNELQTLDQQKAVENVKLQYFEYLLDYLRHDKDFTEVFGPSALGINDPLLNNLITEISKLYAERGRMILSTTERSPQIQAVDQRIMQARRSLEENISSIGKASQILVADLDDRIMQIERRINQLPQTERELISIQRRFNLNDATYNYLLEKRAEAGIAMAANHADNQVVDAARFKGQVAPRGMLNYAIALALGFTLPLGFFITTNFFNTRISDKSEITDSLDFPILGVIPHDQESYKNKEISLVVSENPKSVIIEAFRAMRANLQFFAPNISNKVIAVTSSQSMEGKTFSSINLALVLAMSGKKTILVGADMRKPKIFKELNLKREPGLSSYLIGESSLDKVIQNISKHNSLSVITSGPVPPNPTELLESAAMDKLLVELKQQYDYIVIDTPPVGLVPDALGLLKKADIALYIFRLGHTHRGALEFVHDLVQKTRLSNFCLAVNDAKMGNAYGYGYGYGGYSYGKNYKFYGEQEDEVDPGMMKRWLSVFSR